MRDVDLKQSVMAIFVSIFLARQAAGTVDEPASSLPESYKGKYGDGSVEGPYFEGPANKAANELDSPVKEPTADAADSDEPSSNSANEAETSEATTIPRSVFERPSSTSNSAEAGRQIGLAANLSEGVGMQLTFLRQYNQWVGIRSFLGGIRFSEQQEESESMKRPSTLIKTSIHFGSDVLFFAKNPTILTPMIGMGPSWEFVEQRRGEQEAIRDNSPIISYIYGCNIRLGKIFEMAGFVRQLTYFGTPPRDYDTQESLPRDQRRLGLSVSANYRL